MRKAIGAALALQLVVAVPLVAQGAVDSLFPATPGGPVTDAAGIIPDSVEQLVTARLSHLREATGGEIAVVTLATLAGQEPGQVALAIGRRWKVGGDYPVGDKRRNAGVVLLLVPSTPDQRGALYISTGQGVEGFITDARAGQISDEMLPALRDGDYGDAVNIGTALLTDEIARALGSTDTTLVQQGEPGPGIGGLVLLAALLGMILVAVLIAVGSNRGGRGGPRGGSGGGRRRHPDLMGPIIWGALGGFRGGGGFGGGFGGGGFGGGGGGGFGGFGGGGGFSGGGAGRGF